MKDNKVSSRAWIDDWEALDEFRREGGQGIVQKVRHRVSGEIGALKEIRPHLNQNKERRVRFKQEVDALLALDQPGIPKLLGHNADIYLSTKDPLFLVTEWISGPTLYEFVGDKPQILDACLPLIHSLAGILSSVHDVGILHRDIKPDNVILKGSDITSPYIVDFGTAWAGQTEQEGTKELRRPITEQSQELGNRFLRLPEFTAGLHERAKASDVTQLGGLLFYLLTGQYPRMLRDTKNLRPHERPGVIPEHLARDSRWPMLSALLDTVFEWPVSNRFQTSQEFVQALSLLVGATADKRTGEESPRDAIRKLFNSREMQHQADVQKALRAASVAFQKAIQSDLNELTLLAGGSGPNFIEGGWGDEVKFYIVRSGQSQPQAHYSHWVAFSGDRIRMSRAIEDLGTVVYYDGG